MFALANSLAAAGFKASSLQAAMLAAVNAAGGSAWYVPDDYLTLGPELIPDGSFNSSAGWSLGAGWSITGGKLVATAAATGTNAVINVGLVAGKSYLITYDIDSISAGATTPIANGATSTQQTTSGQKVSFITPVGSTGNVGLNSSSATALTASFDNFSVREILSAKDFQDSAGTLPAYLGGTVGLGLDAAGSVGAELIGDVDFNDPSNWNLATAAPATSTISGGKLRIYSPAAESSSAIQAVSRGTATVGKLYKFTLDVEAYTGTAGVHFAGSGATAIPAGTGIKTIYAVADGAQFGVKRLNVCDITINSISVKEISGNAVTQATAGNRPTISRIPRKFGSEKALAANYVVAAGGYDNTLSGVSGSGFTAIAGTTASRVALTFATEIGKTYNITTRLASGPASGTVQAYSRDVANGAGATISFTPIMTVGAIYNFQFTATSTTSSVLWVASVAAQGFAIDSVSVKEVFEFSNALTFDGNDSLAAPASIIGTNLSQPYTMISWGRVGTTTFNRYMQGDSARALGISAALKPTLIHSGMGGIYGSTTLQQGQMVIIEVAWDGATSKIYLNGVLDASGAHAAPTLAPTAHSIGQFGNAGNYWNEAIGGCVVCPAVMTAAQRLAVRKFAAAQMGLTL